MSPGNDTRDKDRLPGEERLAHAYRDAGSELPPAALDARILAEAHRAAVRARPHNPFGARWVVPLSTAAVVVVAVGVMLTLERRGALEQESRARAPVEAPAASEPAKAKKSSSPPAAVPVAKPSAREQPKPAAPRPAVATSPAEPMPSKPAASAPPPRPAPEAATLGLAANAPVAAPAPAREADAARRGDERLGALRAEDATLEKKVDAARQRLAKKEVALRASGADVIAVQVRGAPGAYDFEVAVRSPDTGCQQYADWWEVVSEDGKLLYRRVLFHSHADEQPFARSGGPVPVQADQPVWVRAHMSTSGYGGAALKGTAAGGFVRATPPPGFAAALAGQPPLPEGCAF